MTTRFQTIPRRGRLAVAPLPASAPGRGRLAATPLAASAPGRGRLAVAPLAASALGRGLLALAVALLAAPALADDDCDTPVERWQSRDAVRQMAAQRGWQVQRLKIDDGCYEIRGKDAEGREFKAKLDPETLEVVKMKRRDRDQDRKREHDARGAPPAPSASAPNPLFTPGTAPRGQVE